MNAPTISTHEQQPPEKHYVMRSGWLRAAVLGANDGLLSTSSLMVGVAAAAAGSSQLIFTGVAGIAAGAMSMAAGEFVSVSSQTDSETADIERERLEIATDPDHERRELTAIYIRRGLSKDLAKEVGIVLSEQDALGAHMRDELGITETSMAHPVQAALASAASFTAGGLPPLLAVLFVPAASVLWVITIVAIIALAGLGAAGARAGGAKVLPSVIRVVLWGTIAMGVTAAVGHMFHAAVGQP
ncbi:MAG: hypothetical protein JWO15_271 [Sphingomonadales bacterium]|nr:hypothetical protein [Sphingomonadales bacterium]